MDNTKDEDRRPTVINAQATKVPPRTGLRRSKPALPKGKVLEKGKRVSSPTRSSSFAIYILHSFAEFVPLIFAYIYLYHSL